MSIKKLEVLKPKTSLAHDSAHLHVTGDAHYVDDTHCTKNELYVGLVTSPHAKAIIKKIDVTRLKKMPDIKGVFTAEDLFHNRWGSICADQPLLAEGQVNYVGEVIAVVACTTKDAVKKALNAIRIDFAIQQPILSIKEARARQEFIGTKRIIKTGDAEHAIKNSPHTLSGVICLQGAEHFYLENQSIRAIPLEDSCLEIHASTQHPTEVQAMVAECLGLPFSSVVCIAKRLGGGFGGKETQAAPFAVYAALVAQKCNAPARLVLTKDEDMALTGKRNPYEIHYTVGFDEKGQVLGLLCQFYGDGGAYADLSTAILERAMAHVDNAYYVPHATIEGIVCRTNFHPHTAFRGFGGPKGVAVIEHVMEEIGYFLNVDALDIRKINCYQKDRNTTHYGQVVENNLLPDLFTTLENRCSYRARREQIEKHNAHKDANPRGMSLTAIKFGISFTTRFLNQGNALVHLFRDGSVSIATGAIEMGQGVFVRILGLVADCLGVDHKKIRILPTATDKNTNTSPTAASSGTDLNGTAALIACQKLKQRLSRLFIALIDLPKEQWPAHTAPFSSYPEFEPNDDAVPSVCFKNGHVFLQHKPEQKIMLAELINAAYLSRIPLSAYGFYKVPDLDFNKITGKGRAFHYFTQGVACSEVEVNRLSGEVKVLRTDILMDLGNPINYAMDIGQITGGFVQGLGWILMENLFYDEKGVLISHSPSTYKIPTIHDIPRIFNVDLIKNDGNVGNIYGTKASGEPPLMLCFSIWNAIKDALGYQRPRDRLPNLPVPATNEVIFNFLHT